jgi:hypothetical protein
MSGYFDAYGDWVALIPFSQLAFGNHKLFAMQASSKGSSTRDACRHVWPDGSWSGFDCEYSIGETFTFSVAVPSHGTNSPKLDGPPAAAQSFFDKSTFSGLKPIEPTKVASQVASGSGLAGVLTVLVAFPTLFLSKALDDIHGKLARKNRLGWMDKTVTGMWAMAMFFLAAILGGFSDPNFGINLESLRVLITGFLGFVLMDFGRNLIVFWATKKDSRQEYPQLSARPFFLLVILGTVVIARLSAIDPAMVFGSVIAIELGAAIEEHTKGKVKLYTLLYTFLLGIAAWVGYSYLTNLHLASLPGLANMQSGNFLIWLQMCQVSLGEFLSMVAVSSFSTIPITLLPFANLGGKPLLDWRRWVWVLMYFVGILGYTVVVLPMPRSWAKPSEPFSVWMGILAIYTVVALTLFVGITARNRKLERLAKLYPGR